MSADVDQALSHWTVFIAQLKPMVHLLHHDHLRNRLVATTVMLAFVKPDATSAWGLGVMTPIHS